jgi:hypothetical protein
MSWGFFLDLDVTLATTAWEQLQSVTAAEVPRNWWALTDELNELLTAGGYDDVTFADTMAAIDHGFTSVTGERDTTRVVLLTILDDANEPQRIAKPVAAFCTAAAAAGASGGVQLVNDGSYARHPGIKIMLQSGFVFREEVADDGTLRDALATRLFAPIAERFAKGSGPVEMPMPRAKAKPTAKARPKAKAKPTTKAKPKPRAKAKKRAAAPKPATRKPKPATKKSAKKRR